MSKKNTSLSAAQGVVDLIGAGLDAKKCRRCGKMAAVITGAARAFEASQDPEVRGLTDKVAELRARTLKQASSDFGCGGCWGSKARKELAKSFKAGKVGKRKGQKSEPELIEAGEARPMRRGLAGTFAISVEDGLIKCLHYTRRGALAHVVNGREAAAIVTAMARAGLVKRAESAAYLGWELARAEAALASGEPYAARPWGIRE